MLIGITYRSVHIHIYIYIGEPSGNSFPFNLKENRKSPLHSNIHYPKLSWKYPQKCCRQMEITWRSAFTTLQAASQYLCRQFTMKQFESQTVNQESQEFESSWCLLNLCVGTAVGNKISIGWWPEQNNSCQIKIYFGKFYNSV